MPGSALPLVDTHCHLTVAPFDADRDEVIGRARQAGLLACVVVAIDAASARMALHLAEEHPGWIHPPAGLHPHEETLRDEAAWRRVEELLDSGRFVAVGETGLDAYHDRIPMEEQVRSLHRHVAAAIDRDLPVIPHCRDAFERLADELARYSGQPLRGVLHCYTGAARERDRLLAAGLHIGVGGIATFKANGWLREVLQEVPEERLLVETDAPWLAPQPVRGRRNEPAWVTHVAEQLAADRGRTPEEVAALTTANADRLFSLGLGGGPSPRPSA
jgi:TatD DNase family protein